MKKLALLFTAIWIALLLTPSVHAADITLSSSCTLADAIIAANHDRPEGGCPAGRGADTIILTRDITLDSGLPKITSDITIEGEGYAISDAYRWRIFYNDDGALTIKDLTMTDGYVEGDIIRNADNTLKATADQPFGGAIVNWQGTLTISDSIFSDNLATGGGAIYNDGELSISDSSFSHNSAREGGAIVNWEESDLSIVNSSFSRNSAALSGAIINAGKLNISGSAFSYNSADVSGGAIFNRGELNIGSSAFSYNSAKNGGAIFNYCNGGPSISISGSAFSYNSAEEWGGAIDNGVDGELSISGSTFSYNSAALGGAIINAGELSMVNSFIVGRGGNACHSSNRLKHNINNFIQDSSCSPAWRD